MKESCESNEEMPVVKEVPQIDTQAKPTKAAEKGVTISVTPAIIEEN